MNRLWTLFSLVFFAAILAATVFIILMSGLPDVDTLKDIRMQVPMRIYTADHKLIAEYGEKRRIPVTFNQVPKDLINAVLATEDQRFFEHPGVDVYGLMRAVVQLVKTGTKSQGGSTITMQVARNFFLTRQKTYLRKFKEILLAIKIDHELSKDKILELYLNKIYLGNRAYGVGAAARVYYGKPLSDLNLAQMAMIAGLPKAPSSLNPIANPQKALLRRNHVLERMYELNFITKEQFEDAVSQPISARYHGTKIEIRAPYVAEMVRQALYTRFGNDAYTSGYQVFTTVNSRLQKIANTVLQKGLKAYDERHGYRGPIENLGIPDENQLNDWLSALKKIPTYGSLVPAAIIELNDQSANAILANGDIVTIAWPGLAWARLAKPKGHVGARPETAADVVALGDVVYLEHTQQHWRLSQQPEIEGSIINLDPKTGAIKALVGGFAYNESNFNRATQATRQPGSAFKPFIYSAALAKGFTLASIINDAPIVKNDPSLESVWRPQNDNRRFNGPTRLRVGLTRSRNLVSIRLLEQMTIPFAVTYLQNFGFKTTDLPQTLSLALGSVSITPMQLASGYAILANGGKRVEPHVIDKITDAVGDEILEVKPEPQQVVSEQIAYLMTLVLRDVIQHGTGRRAKVLKRSDLAGKTGTTNDKVDAWFSGFNQNMVTTVWVGYDQPRSIYEYGAQAALPIWINFMKQALAGQPETRLIQPPGIVTVRIDKSTGLLAPPGDNDTLFEYFRQENAPTKFAPDDNLTAEEALEAGL